MFNGVLLLCSDQRPSCRELVVRIEEIIREVCPEVEGYDATADTEFHALRTAQADMQRRQQEMSRPRQAKLRTKKDVYVSQFVRMRVRA